MEFIKTTVNNIDINIVKTTKFKTTRIQVSFVGDLEESTVTQRALVPYILKTVSKKYPEEELLQKKLEDMYAASLNIGINKISDAHTITFDMSFIDNRYTLNKEDLIDEGLALLQEIIYNPLFTEEVFQSEKRLLNEYFQGVYSNKMKYAMTKLYESMFKEETFRINHLGNQEALQHVTIEEVESEYHRLIKDNLMFITVVGNVDVAEISKKISTTFSSNGITSHASLVSNEDMAIEKVNIITEEQDINQAKLACGYRFDARYLEEDYFAAIVLNLLLGGSSESLLFQEIREKHGLVYFINSSYNPYKGVLFIYAGIDQDDYEKVVEETEKIIKRIRNGSFDDELIDICKKLFINGVIQGMDSNYSLAGKISQSYLFDFDYDVETTIQKMNNVKKEDVMKVSEKLRKDTVFLLRGKKS